MIERRTSAVVFGPIIVTGLALAVLHLAVFKQMGEIAYASAYLLLSFGLVALFGIASIRARFATRPSSALLTLMCASPLLLSLCLTPPESGVDPKEFHFAAFRVWAAVDLRALGATLSFSLFLADAVALSRFVGGVRPKRAIAMGLLFALPFQLPWLIPAADLGISSEIVAAHLCSLVAVVALPLSLQRGGAQTGRILVSLAMAQAMVSTMFGHVLVDCAFGYHGCGPAPKSFITAHCREALYPIHLFELVPWLPGAAAVLLLAVLIRVPRNIGGALAASATVLIASLASIAKTPQLIPDDALTAIDSDFLPRGRGRSYLHPLRISQTAVFDADKVMVLQNPLHPESTEALGQLLHRAAWPLAFDPCWRKGADHLLSTIDITLDARLTNRQLAHLIRTGRSEGIQVFRLVEGESHQPLGNPYLLSTHVMGLVTDTKVGPLVIDPQGLPSSCRSLPTLRLDMQTDVMGEFDALDDFRPSMLLELSPDLRR